MYLSHRITADGGISKKRIEELCTIKDILVLEDGPHHTLGILLKDKINNILEQVHVSKVKPIWYFTLCITFQTMISA